MAIASLQNPLVKQIRKLHQAKQRHQQQLCLLEGTHLLQEACRADRSLVTVCCTSDWRAAHCELWEQLCQRSQRAELVSPEVLKSMATTVQPDGAIATLQRQANEAQFCPPVDLALGLETIQDPGNLGTIVRSAAAAGASGLWLSADSVDFDHPKVLRASAGQWFRLSMSTRDDLSALVRQCQAAGMQAVATVPTAKQTFWQIDLRSPTLILLGNEGAGLSPELVALANERVTIPLQPGVESLNVAIAAALILYEARRQRGF